MKSTTWLTTENMTKNIQLIKKNNNYISSNFMNIINKDNMNT